MTVVDGSAILAILLAEPDAARFAAALHAAPTRHVSVASLLEVAIGLLRKRGGAVERALDAFVARAGLHPLAVDEGLLRLARAAFRRYGKGRHRVSLNFGDCFAYALARHLDEPLLFKGGDFGHTDVARA